MLIIQAMGIVRKLNAYNVLLPKTFFKSTGNEILNARIVYKASQAIQSPRTLLFFLLISLLNGYSFANVHVKGIVAFNIKKN